MTRRTVQDKNRPRPEDFGIEARFRHWQGDRAEDHTGPFFFVMDGERALTRFRVQPHNCNSHGIAHGGVLMMFADYTLCIAALAGEGGGESAEESGVVTVTCNNEFLAPAAENELVRGTGEVTRRGGSLIFVRATLEAGGRTVLTASGVIRKLRRKA